jgi:hypothetical protein
MKVASTDSFVRKIVMRKRILAAAFVVGLSRLAFAEPKIEILEPRWDFGHVPQQSVLTHDYWIKNIGTDTLKIVRVKPG